MRMRWRSVSKVHQAGATARVLPLPAFHPLVDPSTAPKDAASCLKGVHATTHASPGMKNYRLKHMASIIRAVTAVRVMASNHTASQCCQAGTVQSARGSGSPSSRGTWAWATRCSIHLARRAAGERTRFGQWPSSPCRLPCSLARPERLQCTHLLATTLR